MNAALLAMSIALCALSTIWWNEAPLVTFFYVVSTLLYAILYTPWDDITLLSRVPRSHINAITNVVLFGGLLALAAVHAIMWPEWPLVLGAVALIGWAVIMMAGELWYVATGHEGPARRLA